MKIKSVIKYSFAIMLACNLLSVHAEDLPKNIESQLPSGYDVIRYASGSLRDDLHHDYLVALSVKDEKRVAEKLGESPLRPLLIFIQNENHTFSLIARNDHVIFGINDGGQCDPFLDDDEGLAIKGGYFTVENGVSCGSHWTDFITFHYDLHSANWLFHKRIMENWVMNNSNDPNADALILEHRDVTKGNSKRPVLFKDYRP